MTQKKMVLGTFNKDKRREISQLLKKERVKVLSLKDFPGCEDVVENMNTFAGNAEKKARQYSRHTKLLTLADDSGLMVSALNGKPGVHSARFAGPGCTYEDNNRKLLRLMKKLPLSRRNAMFVCVMALYDDGKRVGTVRGECRGRIAFEARGKHGFGYDPVFVPNGMSRTFAELRPEEKNKISHRGRALRAARRLIVKYLRER